jgi:valyl-tRNA synthetase
MDSSVSPLFVSKHLRDDKFFALAYPTGIRPQGKDIVRTWLYYTLLRCYQLTKRPAFEHAWISGYCVDDKGEKMSKSKGNVLDPIPILERHGGDSFRFWAASESSLGSDFRASEDRVDVASKFLTKLWNVSRFISSFSQVKNKPKLEPLDSWIIGELENLTAKCLEGYQEFNFFIPSNAVREFVWNVFAPHYLEMAKSRAYGSNGTKAEQEAARYTLHFVLKETLKLIAPVVPFITDHIYRELYSKKGVHGEVFPKAGKSEKMKFTTEELIELNSQIWKAKKDNGMSLKAEVKGASIPEKFRLIEKDLKNTHSISQIKWFKDFSLSF